MVLYHSVRIDMVHYCRLEAHLAEKRKKTSHLDRNGIPTNPALARLRLFRRTVREDPIRIGKVVQFLKTPFMIRESWQVELAQTIAVLPNLQYVDLPERMFTDEPNNAMLRREVQVRCCKLRKIAYSRGSECWLVGLASQQVWLWLEVLELNSLDVDPLAMRAVLASLTRLRALKVTKTHSFSDELMAFDDGLPPLVALEELILKDTPRMTTVGLIKYLSSYETQNALKVLTRGHGRPVVAAARGLGSDTKLEDLGFPGKGFGAFPEREVASTASIGEAEDVAFRDFRNARRGKNPNQSRL
ncbi:uncharacterized protein HRG_08618 [Hirsutella rhossiliensis]|uniref:Uncharacterized protein n=1 Tax=Hirsutella rhossiliensis TaxID=111463 RepID=A0A9P8MQL1_9HYPO|nr:uncharacterized protein HRG_08618 [Hirsutella rhossiliensis]KAH0960463.1 hypothetical protein HRG_08618 [Hirsutella rhossiliensis]